DTPETQDVGEQEQKVQETPIPVKVAQAQRGDLVITLKSPGEAVTNMMVAVKAEVEGVIQKLRVEEGQHVNEGDLLVELDDRRYRLELERYEADRLSRLSELLLEERFGGGVEEASSPNSQKIAEARKAYEEARELHRKGMISDKDLEDAYQRYELALIESGEKKQEIRAASKGLTQAEIAVKTARLNLEKTKIRAPFSGIITEIQVSPQEHVSPGQELFKLVNISHIQVHAKVLESEVGKMKEGREARLRFSAYPEKVFLGKVKAISPIVNPEDKTCRVIIEVANPEEELKPGMHADVEIPAEVYKDRLLVPQEAVLVRGGRKLVFVVKEGLAKWRYIQVGLENDDFAEVLPSPEEGGGVEEGDLVIVEGHFTLAHDARVKIES
ncbi:MAG: efflux RND transporter periplasmic adaptor subunit, partial [Candidatus Aminicenantales bacterium]